MNVVAFASDRSDPEAEVEWGSEAWILPGSREEMMRGWEDWSPDCQKILEVSGTTKLCDAMRSSRLIALITDSPVHQRA